jgi:hypothetical protein
MFFNKAGHQYFYCNVATKRAFFIPLDNASDGNFGQIALAFYCLKAKATSIKMPFNYMMERGGNVGVSSRISF